MGMTGFDSVTSSYASLRSGMAAVPVTHMLHTIDANSSILSKARDIVGKLSLPSFEPAFA